MSEISHWFRIIVVNIVSVALSIRNLSMLVLTVDPGVFHDIFNNTIGCFEYHR